MPGQRLVITPSLLARAWAASVRGAGWPATFGEALAHPLYSRLLRATAVGMAQQAQRPAAAGPCRPATPGPMHSTQLLAQHQQPDLKRRAAGDRDDD